MRFLLFGRLGIALLVAVALSACSSASNSVPSTSTAPVSNSQPMSKGGPTTFLPISQFVAAQGTCPKAICGDAAGGFIAWISENGVNGCPAGYNIVGVIDYAGIDNAFIVSKGHPSLGTAFAGTVSVATQSDGTALVKVDLKTTKASSYSFCLVPNSGPNAFPEEFGHNPDEVVAGSDPGLGTSQLKLVFRMPTPSSPLPDFLQLTFFGSSLPGYTAISQKFTASATGTLRSQFGVPDGTPGQMSLAEIGLSKHGPTGFKDMDGFTAEHEGLQVSP